MRIAHAKEKSVNVMGNVTNAGNIMQSLNVRDLFIVKKRKRNDERCLPIRKHRGAREKRYSFGYAVFLILALMK